jgi:hypothetical protein
MAEYLKQYKRALKIFERTEDLRNHLLNHQELYGALEPADQVRLEFLSKRLTRVGAEEKFWRFFKLLYPYKGISEYIAHESRPYPLAVDIIGHLDRVREKIENLEQQEFDLNMQKLECGGLDPEDTFRLSMCSRRLQQYMEEHNSWCQTLGRDPYKNARFAGDIFYDPIKA